MGGFDDARGVDWYTCVGLVGEGSLQNLIVLHTVTHALLCMCYTGATRTNESEIKGKFSKK